MASSSNRKVFICHRGVDTKTQFCLWLAPDLWRAGIDPFVDEDSLEMGDRADEKMTRELEEAAVVLVVLSPHFFESRWCLNELKRALELEKAYPVFYGVQPDAAECQQTAERLAREAGKRPPWEECRMAREEWGEAIEQVCRLTGLRLSDYKNRPDLLRTQVVEALAKKLDIALPRIRDNLPLLPDAKFLGRDRELRDLEEKLGEKAVCVSGMPGLGKTHLVSAYAYKHLHEYDLVLWVTAGDADKTITAFAGLATCIQLPVEDNQQKQATIVKDFLEQSGKRCLLIFDNAESEAAVREWLPHRGLCHTIVTTRLTGCFSYCESLVLGELELPVALAVLRGGSVLSQDEERALEELCAEVQRLTFAVRVASSILARGVAPSELLARLRHKGARAYDNLAKEEDTFGRNPSLAALFDESLEALQRDSRPASAQAVALVTVGAWFAPVAVPRPLLVAAAASLSSAFDKDEDAHLEAVSLLVEYSLASRTGNGGDVSFHRLLQLYGQEKSGIVACKAMVAAVQELGVVEAQAEHFEQACTWAFDEVKALVDLEGEELVQFVDKVGLELAHKKAKRNDLEKARTLLGQCFERTSEGTPNWWRALCIKGVILQVAGKLDDAELLQRRALEGRESTLGPMHPATFRSLDNLSSVLQRKGQYAEAEELMRRTLEGRQSVLGPMHAHTVGSMGDLAVLLFYNGKPAEGEAMMRQSIEARRVALGPQHHSTLGVMAGLGSILSSRGCFVEAEEVLRSALEGIEAGLGPTHFKTYAVLDDLAEAVRGQGRYAEAEELNRRALVGRETLVGPNDVTTLSSLNNLGISILYQGRHAEAEQLFRRAFEAKTKAFGPRHPVTLLSAYNVAVAMDKQGKHSEAEQMYQSLLVEQESVLGPLHPATLRTVNSLGSSVEAQERINEAELLFRRAFEGRLAVLGELHPDTQGSLRSLVNATGKKGRRVEARQLLNGSSVGNQSRLQFAQEVDLQSGSGTLIHASSDTECTARQSNAIPKCSCLIL